MARLWPGRSESTGDIHHHDLTQFGGAVAALATHPRLVFCIGAPCTFGDGICAICLEDGVELGVAERSPVVVYGWTAQRQVGVVSVSSGEGDKRGKKDQSYS